MKYIFYIGEDIIAPKDHSIKRYRGKQLLKNNKIYKLKYDWDGKTNINGFWIFYIYDDLCDGEYRGYEIKISDVSTIRNYAPKKV